MIQGDVPNVLNHSNIFCFPSLRMGKAKMLLIFSYVWSVVTVKRSGGQTKAQQDEKIVAGIIGEDR